MIDFQQIPAIPAKFRENFNEKYYILTDFEQNFAKSEKIINFCKFCKNPKLKCREPSPSFARSKRRSGSTTGSQNPWSNVGERRIETYQPEGRERYK